MGDVMKVFVYGTLKKGFGNDLFLKEAKFLGEGVISGKMYSLTAFPYVDINKDGVVHGEIYEITPRILECLDILEGYPNFYNRSDIGNNTWVYHIEHNGKDEEIKSGRWT